MELRPCPACRRHVGVDERACPFCAVALAPLRTYFGAPFTRAAFLSAALVACGDKAPPPPSGGSAPTTPTVDASAALAIDAAAPPVDAEEVATPDDAGSAAAPDDAGTKDDEARKRRLEQLERNREWRRRRMPYGAPPARRRVV